ncbi:rod shape-determining protein MreD [Anaerobacillus alkalilacustris]|uniref:Rod shape-determining protein MreD n=1 Tax=Anaerobacillus alkalilacustris TaxID=393763 RepID=A0A1S2LE97_9BACI|nr:rod shape-determining protein MreD [Anaerobacillus alkalilacustris]OIJ10560.1 rod shape-determining protein MreD [Anaerobacillus alkalilacustris]
MVRFFLPFLIFLLFIIEGTIMQTFSPERFGSEYFIIPRFAFLVVLVLSIFLGRALGTVYGLILGLFQDVVYTHILGIYIFSMGLIAYFLGLSYKLFQKNLFLLIITAVFGTVLLDYLVFGLHTMIGITELAHERFFRERLLPSIIINSVFMIVFAYPLRKFLVFLQKCDDIEEKINKRKKDFRWQR